MGMVRKYQPDAITNLRYGWMGDIIEEEGSSETKGPVRNRVICDKCLTMQIGGWGYNAEAIANGRVMSRDELVRYLANCIVRNMILLVNVAPDRHGAIPTLEQQRLREMGAWLAKAGEAVYGTRGGPWEPTDGRYGYCYRGDTVYVHLLKEYGGDTFRIPPLGDLRPLKAYDAYLATPLHFTSGDRGGTVVSGIDRTASPADTIVGVQYNAQVTSVWGSSAGGKP